MSIFTSKKAIISFLSVGSIVLAGTIKDIHSHDAAKSFSNLESVEREIIPIERNVASEAVAKAAQLYLPVNPENSRKVDGVWEITRVVGSDEKEFFLKANPEDSKRNSNIKMKLVNNGIVHIETELLEERLLKFLKIEKRTEHTYIVSNMNYGKIAIYKKSGAGYVIIEATKVEEAKGNSSLVVSEEVELVLERARNQAKSDKILLGNDVSGRVSLTAKQLTGLEVELRNANGESQNIQIDQADLLDGGAFKAEVNGEEVSGIVLNNGKDGYVISFVTGPLAGSMLNFVTNDQLEKIQETERDQADAKEMVNEEEPKEQPAEVAQAAPQKEEAPQEEVQQAAEKVIEERKDTAVDTENQEQVPVLSADEIKETAKENGYAF